MSDNVYTPRVYQVFITILLVLAMIALFIPGFSLVQRSDVAKSFAYGTHLRYRTVSFHDANATDTTLPTLFTAIAMIGGIICIWKNKPQMALVFSGIYLIDEIIYIVSLSRKTEYYLPGYPEAGFYIFTALTVALIVFCFIAIRKTVEGVRPGKSRSVSQTVVSPSNADEIRKFRQLLDEGIITQEEYESKKKELM